MLRVLADENFDSVVVHGVVRRNTQLDKELMDQLLESAIYEGMDMDLSFVGEQPGFGDLFQICGCDHPRFPRSGKFNFGSFSGFGFEQVDDYFGIPSHAEDGDGVIVWLYPLIDGQPVYHHPGPFSGVRLSFNVLRNSEVKGEFFLHIVEQFIRTLSVQSHYPLRNLELGSPPDLAVLRADMKQIVEHWRAEDIEPGSAAALELVY